MLLGFDIGNTNVVMGAFKGAEIILERRAETHPLRTSAQYASELQLKKGVLPGEPSACIIASVVPELTPLIAKHITQTFNLNPLVIDWRTHTGVELKIDEPSSAGADRIVNAAAVRSLYGVPALVVDFGTAITFDVVDAEGAFCGGIIAPGVKISMEALAERTAKLPKIDLAWPAKLVATDTVSAMQAGLMAGCVCMVDGLIGKLRAEFGGFKHVVATGGLGAVLSTHSAEIEKYDAQLTLQGLRIIAGLNGLCG